ncbi:MAG: hypothetical protein JWQ42_4716 [Edaphobacter sp.]|nr:hypothetical protein [Edaphobacter sp.]
MAVVARKSIVAVDCPPGFRPMVGDNERRDLQRFLRKHGPSRKSGRLLPPKNLGQPRRIKLSCPHEHEAN